MNYLESAEDYLERILMLHKKNNVVRAIDIANDMNFTKASVSIAMKKLKNKNLIVIDEKNGNITLTTDGRKIAEEIFERHLIISETLIKLGVTEEVAKKDACKIEHDLSEETFLALKKYYENLIKNK